MSNLAAGQLKSLSAFELVPNLRYIDHLPVTKGKSFFSNLFIYPVTMAVLSKKVDNNTTWRIKISISSQCKGQGLYNGIFTYKKKFKKKIIKKKLKIKNRLIETV